MIYSVLSVNKDKLRDVKLDPRIFDVAVRRDIISEVVRWQLAGRRQGTRKTKVISEISGSTRKYVRQKGSGRARQGSIRTPQHVGGAVVFGPVNRSHSFKLNKKFVSLGLKSILSLKIKLHEITIIDSIPDDIKKTSDIEPIFDLFGNGKRLLIISDNFSDGVRLAVRNLYKVNILLAKAVNVYDILRHGNVLITESGINMIEDKLCG